MTKLLLLLVPTLTLAACGASKEARATCEHASKRYTQCVGELLGPEAKKMVEAKEDIGGCAGDSKTVEMYKACLPKDTCDAFMDCMNDYVEHHGP